MTTRSISKIGFNLVRV